jgi:hypothetical protein
MRTRPGQEHLHAVARGNLAHATERPKVALDSSYCRAQSVVAHRATEFFVRRSRIHNPIRTTAWSLARRFSLRIDFFTVCITLARYLRWLIGFNRSCGQLSLNQRLFPQAIGLTRLPMLGSTAICSAVPAIRFPPGLLAPLSSFIVDAQLTALLTAEHFCRMTAHKRSIAPLPQALAG